MTLKTIVLTLVVGGLMLPTVAAAQQIDPGGIDPAGPGIVPGPGPGTPGDPHFPTVLDGGGYWDYSPYEGSTVYGDYARGYADVVRAYGQNSLLNSMAARNYSEARSKEIENRYKYAKTYFEMREMNRAYRAQERGPRATEAQLIRYAAAGAPDKLGPEQLDPYTGAINWPAVLRTETFAKQRQLVEQIFANRVLNDGRIPADDYIIFEQAINQMSEMLKQRIQLYDTNDYLDARGFLASLDYEATS